MELMLIVWLVSIISNLPEFLCLFVVPLMVAAAIGLLVVYDPWDEEVRAERLALWEEHVFYPKTIIAMLIALVIIPSESAMKYMSGAYLLQSTYQSDFVQQAIPLSQKAVLNQLNRWAEDSTELKNLLLENQNAGEKGN